ncbi:MAG: threonylcarbamoyl-AMP synthase [Gammaproteobacteria bacterium]|nr:threonylcarbamoyl-AMP synthase [Gammaproteobacteria bacterium]
MTSTWQLKQAASTIRKGGVIAYPTEAVWGLGCNPWHAQAVQRILHLKQRPVHKGVILVAASMEQFDWLLQDLAPAQRQLLEDSWPGPNTWLVPHHNRVPGWISGRHSSVALRVSSHPLIQALCSLTGPLVSTSANPAGRPAATSRLRIEQYFHGRLDTILNAPLGRRQQPSTIRDLASGALIRG